jgi:hypothetical protein
MIRTHDGNWRNAAPLPAQYDVMLHSSEQSGRSAELIGAPS